MARTRDPAVDQAIHRAAVELLASVGLGGVTFEAVARRAGVARTSVYRRYEDVGALVGAAVDDVLGLPGPRGDHEPEAAWRLLVRSLRAALVDSPLGLPLLAGLVLADRRQPQLLELWRSRVIQPRLTLIADVLGVGPDRARLLGELAFGGLVARYIARGEVTDDDADELAGVLLRLPHHPL
jgi:AcrR family transcriptional regulator